MHPGTAGAVVFTALLVAAAVVIAVVRYRERGERLD
jgi:heme/copper-type cytochrome/quinol oxidase subunit 2